MFVDIYNTNKTYKTIYLDPPWMERGGGKIKRGADRHYPLMKTEDIIKLPIDKLADKDGCHLYLWTTNNFLPDALKCLEAWGFKYITMITWIKDKEPIDIYCKFELNKDIIEKEDFKQLYEYGYTTLDIAKMAGCCDWTVRNVLKNSGVKLRNRGKVLNNQSLSNYQKEIIDGEMLGDGHIDLGEHYKNAYMSFHFKRIGHIHFLYENLQELEPNFSKRKDIGDREGYTLWTKCNPYLTLQYKRWYNNKVKIIPKDINLTPTVCFHWYIGDGSYNNGIIYLYSLAYTFEENIFLSEKLKELGFDVRIHKKQCPSGEKYYLAFTKKSSKEFLEYIGDPDNIPCYAYKWGLKEEEIEKIEISQYDNCSLGQYYRGQTEHCIFAVTKNRLPYKKDENGKRQQGKTGFIAPKKEHSKKPQKMREMIENVSYEPRIELFAREKFNGWDCWGNEI